MKTPDEIKKGLECCTSHGEYRCTTCKSCPYRRKCPSCEFRMHKDALAYIQKLEERLKVAEIDRKELWGKVLKHGR